MLQLYEVSRTGIAAPEHLPVTVQSTYRKAVATARRDKKQGKPQGLTEEQKQEIRWAPCCEPGGQRHTAPFLSQAMSQSTHDVASVTFPRIAALCIREAFDLFDTDGSGHIDAKELKVAMRCALCGTLSSLFGMHAHVDACMHACLRECMLLCACMQGAGLRAQEGGGEEDDCGHRQGRLGHHQL